MKNSIKKKTTIKKHAISKRIGQVETVYLVFKMVEAQIFSQEAMWLKKWENST